MKFHFTSTKHPRNIHQRLTAMLPDRTAPWTAGPLGVAKEAASGEGIKTWSKVRCPWPIFHGSWPKNRGKNLGNCEKHVGHSDESIEFYRKTNGTNCCGKKLGKKGDRYTLVRISWWKKETPGKLRSQEKNILPTRIVCICQCRGDTHTSSSCTPILKNNSVYSISLSLPVIQPLPFHIRCMLF